MNTTELREKAAQARIESGYVTENNVKGFDHAIIAERSLFSGLVQRRAKVGNLALFLTLHGRKGEGEAATHRPTIIIGSKDFDPIWIKAESISVANGIFDSIRCALRNGINQRGRLIALANTWLDIDRPKDTDIDDLEAFAE